MQYGSLTRRTGKLVVLASLLCALAACGGGGSGGGNGGGGTGPVNTAPSRVAISDVIVMDGQPTAGGFAVGELVAEDDQGDAITFGIAGGADQASFSLAGSELLLDVGVVNALDQDRYEVTVRATDTAGLSTDLDVVIQVYTSPALSVGYYDILQNVGQASQETPITAIGDTAVAVGDFAAADLSDLDMLFVQNPTSAAPTGPYAQAAGLERVADFVAAGGVLVFHDRWAAGIEYYLPGNPGAIVDEIGQTRTEFDVVDTRSFVALGPGGSIDDDNLEGPNALSFGYLDATTAPQGAAGYLSRSNPDHWVSYAYPFGNGHVIYSTIPLDFYLQNGNPEVMRSTYAPNILAQARALRRKGDDGDGDGLLDIEESLLGTNAASADSDGDGMDDRFEVRGGLDPSRNDAAGDLDGDGLSNSAELAAGTRPNRSDTDEDGLTDGDEVNVYSTDPLNVDTDGDSLTDFQEVSIDNTSPILADTDTGGTDDGRELLVDGTDPLDPSDDVASTALPLTLTDVDGFAWDVQRNLNINNGSNDAYDGGMVLGVDGVGFPNFDIASLSESGRELRAGVQQTSGLSISRRLYVPETLAFARYLEVLDNPGDTDVTTTLTINTNLGSDGDTVIVATSDGDATVETTDTWVVSDDASNGGGDPTLAHVIAGSGAAVAPASFTAPLGRLAYSWEVTVPANGRAIVMHFASQNANRTVAQAKAGFLAGLGNGTLAEMSANDIAAVVNFDLAQPATTSRPALAILPLN